MLAGFVNCWPACTFSICVSPCVYLSKDTTHTFVRFVITWFSKIKSFRVAHIISRTKALQLAF